MFSVFGNQLMGAGFSAGQASALLGGNVGTAISAAGTTLATATDLAATVNLVSTATAGQGVQLPSGCSVGDVVVVFNDNTGATFLVYPDSSSNKINQLSAGTGVNLATNTSCIFMKATGTRWIANMSA